MSNTDLYILGCFFISLGSAWLGAHITKILCDNRQETHYIELDISPTTIRQEAADAIYHDCHTLILPPVTVQANGTKIIQLAFVDQRLRLEATYANSPPDDDNEEGEAQFVDR